MLRRAFLAVLLLALLPAMVRAQTVEYYHLDARGSVRAITDQTGAVIERHDYLPFGEEWNPAPTTDPRKFTGKERDAETGYDYFGARYLSSKTARFTTTDPAFSLAENLVDPQRWNKYSYSRNNPFKYVDPTGAILELTGSDRGKAFEIIKGVAGSDGAKLLSMRTAGNRTFVEYSGKDRDSLAATGELGVYLADIIDSNRTTEFGFATSVTTKHVTFTTAYKGGGATVGSEESLNGNIQIFMHPNAASIMNQISTTIWGRKRSSNLERALFYSNPIIAAHEFGHAWANLHGDALYPSSNATDATALRTENLMRARLGQTETRIIH